MEIITGYTGKPHVTSEQDRDVNIGVVGEGSYVLQTGMQLAAEVSSNNEIKIRDGVLMHQGCTASIKKNTYDSLTIINGSQGMKRIDLIVARYEKNQDNRTEGLDLKVIQGTPAESNPVVPEYTEGDIQAGDYVADMPMYQVIIDGLNITEVKKVFEVAPSIDAMKKEIAELNSKSPKVFKSSDSDFISFIAPFDCIAIVSFSCAGWGMNGEFLEFKIKNDQSILQEMFVHTGACSGNNNVYIPLNAKSGFSGLKKGSSYSFSRQNLYGSFGMSWNRQWSAVCLPI
jgi:hypothetical protein